MAALAAGAALALATPFAVALARTLPLAWLGLPVAPSVARMAVGLALALAVLPAAATTPHDVPLALLLVREITAGLALGLVASIPLRAAETAGGLVDEASRGGQGRSLGRALLVLAVAVFASLGGPLLWVRALGESYAALPVGHAAPGGAPVAIEAVARLIVAAVELASPALAALLAAAVAVGLVARAAPSLVATGGGGSARQLVGLGAIGLSAAALCAALRHGAGSIGDELVAAARALAG